MIIILGSLYVVIQLEQKCLVVSCSCSENGLNCSEACTYQGCENMAKVDDDDRFDHNVFLSF